jgi:hypothetical protein
MLVPEENTMNKIQVEVKRYLIAPPHGRTGNMHKKHF